MPIYGEIKTPTIIGEGETHKMRYEVMDFAGNKSILRFTLRGRRNAALGEKEKPKGDLVAWEKTWAKDTLGIDVLIPHHSLYEDCYVDIVRTDRGATLPAAYTIGDTGIPMQKSMVVTMSVPGEMERNGEQSIRGARGWQRHGVRWWRDEG